MQISLETIQISLAPYTLFPTHYVRISRSMFGMGGLDLGGALKLPRKLKCYAFGQTILTI